MLHWLLTTVVCSVVASNVTLGVFGFLRAAQTRGRLHLTTPLRGDAAMFGIGAALALVCYAVGFPTLAGCLFATHQTVTALCIYMRHEADRMVARMIAEASAASPPVWVPAGATMPHDEGDEGMRAIRPPPGGPLN